MPESKPAPSSFSGRLIGLARENPEQVRWLGAVVGVFLLIYFLPAGTTRFDNAVLEGIRLTQWYAQEHVILCLLPAFLIAGAMAAYLSEGAVMRYLGPNAPKPVAFGMASISGTLLAVCSCTVLPLFGGIYRRGAGLGPAVAFLYSGPAINIMAIVVTAKVLGLELGLARAIGAIVFAVVIGVIMHLLYRREEQARAVANARGFSGELSRPLGQIAVFFGLMVGILVFANWAAADSPTWMAIHTLKWHITAVLSGFFALLLIRRWGWPLHQVAVLAGAVTLAALLVPDVPELAFAVGIIGLMLIATLRDDDREWAEQSWDFTKQIMPLLLVGVFVAGLLLGRPGEEGLIPSEWVVLAVGDNGFRSTFLASLLGGFMYFSTLTEVPIVQGLIGNGMGKGPALALLLAGPALSLPNMLVIRTIMGTRKTMVYCTLVVVMSTVTGYLYGQFWP
ncbi:permease [Halomonas sp. BC04]|uniref:permease n=1 Tax=Halomonas sp. BC04 TaxID=1403540 RepID=UPI0003ED6FDF|nr:permease [Halomonas sp. BC04]EWH01543.1 permease [Halomonas sp. BC04]